MVLIRFEPSVTHRCTSVCNSDVDSRVYSVFYMLFFITMQVQTHRKPHGKAEGRWFTEIGPESQTEKSFFFLKEEKWESEAERQRERHIMKLCSAASMKGSNLQIKDGLICHPSAGESPQWEWEASASQPTLTTTLSVSQPAQQHRTQSFNPPAISKTHNDGRPSPVKPSHKN